MYANTELWTDIVQVKEKVTASATWRICTQICGVLWGHWFRVTIAWYACALWVVVVVHNATHKEMLSVYSNTLVSTALLTFIFAAICGVDKRGRRCLLHGECSTNWVMRAHGQRDRREGE
eukprot:SAG22_NODE_66_length_22936_cov_626.714279_23_plen_120_part_00